jgi:hypothetical protein
MCDHGRVIFVKILSLLGRVTRASPVRIVCLCEWWGRLLASLLPCSDWQKKNSHEHSVAHRSEEPLSQWQNIDDVVQK